MNIAWGSLLEVFLIGVGLTVALVVLFAFGITGLAARSAVLDGDAPEGARGPLSSGMATAVAGICFVVFGLVVIYGVYLIVA
ncbi:hypothetical protein GCM10023321_55480 [Pseudonocardia eucalypti]|uniref:Secreted protein n=1 Tax=Pseudonocardia eucalypti TaxID=648755 RepID=A0ABP9QQ22_9PSEU|nr:UPF0716 family protein affecting phage T7 exclusion [Pseudonocardia eucalypti]